MQAGVRERGDQRASISRVAVPQLDDAVGLRASGGRNLFNRRE
jgi:hypothetical protein